jgi:hypothetical protein
VNDSGDTAVPQWPTGGAPPHGAALPDGPVPPESSVAEPPTAGGSRWLRRLRVVGVVLVAVGLFAGGSAFGWRLRGEPEQPPALEVVVDRPVNVAAAAAAGTMPDLVGLAAADAQQALVTAGFTAEQVTVELTPAAGAEGLVVGQQPSAGSPQDAAVVLYVSTAATVPAVVGGVEAEARDALSRLGAQVVVTRTFDPAAIEGTVLAVDPAAGAPLVDRVNLTVAAPPSSVFLSALDPVEGSCSTGQVTVAGQQFADSLSCRAGRSPVEVAYSLEGRATLLQGAVGLSDRAGTGPAVQFRVTGDGNVLLDETVGFGEARPVSIPVAGILRLVVTVELASPDFQTAPVGVFGEMRLVGSPADIDILAAAG